MNRWAIVFDAQRKLKACASAVFLVSQGGGGLEVRWVCGWTVWGASIRFDELSLLRLDRVMGAEYVGFHGVCFPFH